MKHLNSTTRLFVFLLIFTLLVTYLALVLSNKYTEDGFRTVRTAHSNQLTKTDAPELPVRLVSTAGWKDYKDKTYPLAFSYPKSWTVAVSNTKVNDQYSIVLNPPNTPNDIYIYINKGDYLGFSGLNKKPYRITGAEGVKVSDLLVGAKAGEYYYTFDASMNPDQYREFSSLLTTVSFNESN